MSNLRPCPFCGSKPDINCIGLVWCSNRRCHLNEFCITLPRWQHRHVDGALLGALEALTEGLCDHDREHVWQGEIAAIREILK